MIFSTTGEVIYEETSANGNPRNAENAKYFKINLVGTNVACQDAITWGDNNELLVVGCISRNIMASSNTIWIQILDRKTFTPQGDVLKVDLAADSDFRIFNQLVLTEVYDTDAKGNKVPYLMLADKGKSNKNNVEGVNADIIRDNTHFLIFQYLENAFSLENEFAISAGTTNVFDFIQNYFWYNGELVVVSKMNGNPSLQISICDFTVSMEKKNDIQVISCNDSANPLGILNGYAAQIPDSQLWSFVDVDDTKNVLKVTVVNTNNKIATPQVWTTLNSLDNVPVPDDFIHKWIRYVQGNEKHLVIQYTSMDGQLLPAATKDSDLQFIDFGNKSNPNPIFPGWSGNIHSNNLYYVLVDYAYYAVARISGPWWKVTGNQLSPRIDNTVTFTVQEAGVNTVSIVASMFQSSGNGKTVQIDWNPPYLDVHQNSHL